MTRIVKDSKPRNTSTDVEKTLKSPPVKAIDRKHLHGRGEDHFIGSDMFWTVETPPRTWRRPENDTASYVGSGNTSTDVEKTTSPSNSSGVDGKHLHGRGEDQRPISRLAMP